MAYWCLLLKSVLQHYACACRKALIIVFSMKTLSQLAHFISTTRSQKEIPAWALFGFLKALGNPSEAVTPQIINHFFLDSLHHPQWQAQCAFLEDSTFQLLEEFSKAAGMPPEAFSGLLELGRLQVITVEDPAEFYKLIRNYEQRTLREGENVRVLPDGEERMVSLRLTAKQELCVRSYNRSFIINDGQLEPLSAEQQLHYSSDLDLMRDMVHWVRTGQQSTLRFRLESGGVKAWITSGAHYKITESFTAPSVMAESKIFFPVKRLERFYIHRSTDPFYLQTLENLEKAVELLRNESPEAAHFARAAFERGQSALENVFLDDKALYRLLRELATTLTLKGHSLVAGRNSRETQTHKSSPIR